MVDGELRELAGAQPVDAAIADVADDGALAPRVEPQDRDGRAHLLELADPALGDALGRAPRRDDDLVLAQRSARIERERPRHVGVARGAADQLGDGVDRDRAGDLAGFVAAHAVGDDEQAEVGAQADRVLVAGPPAGDGERERIEQHARGYSARRAGR